MTLVVPLSIFDAVRDHAHSVPAGMESLGRLVVRDGHLAVAYVRLRNLATRPGRCILGSSWRRQPGEQNIVVHSHPWGDAWPSGADLAWARQRQFSEFGIYSIRRGELRVWRPLGDRGYRSSPLILEQESRSSFHIIAGVLIDTASSVPDDAE